MKEEEIIVEVDYGQNAVFVDIQYIDLLPNQIEELSKKLWYLNYIWKKDLTQFGKKKVQYWKFEVERNQLSGFAELILVAVAKLFKFRKVTFVESNKYD